MNHKKQRAAAAPPNIGLAVEHHRAGRLQEAEAIYRQLPLNRDALHLRGLVLHQWGRHEEAVGLIRQAIKAHPSFAAFYFSIDAPLRALNKLDELVSLYRQLLKHQPKDATAHHNLGIALKDLGQFEEAEASLHKCLSLAPDLVEAHNNLGILYALHGRQEEAIACYRRVLSLKPDFTVTHVNIAIAFKAQGKLDEAVQACRQALALDPNFADAYTHLGNVLMQQGKLNDAALCHRRALELSPQSADAYSTLGSTLKEQGKLDDAALCYQNAIALKPDFAEAHNNLGVVFQMQSRFGEAIGCYQQAIALKPDYAEAYNNLGQAMADSGQEDVASQCYSTALRLRPDLPEANNNLGVILRTRGQMEEAKNCFLRAIAARPDFAAAHINLGISHKDEGRLGEAVASYRQAIACRPDDPTAYHSLLLAMQYSANVTPEDMFAAHVQFADRFEAPLRARWTAHGNAREPGKRLKIGYVSPDFHKHAVAYFIEPVLALHDKSQVEVFCYYNHPSVDAVTLRLQQLAEHWVPCKHLSDDQLAERIRADGIDILVDLAGHTGNNRLLTFARKPAPVQVTWLGYPATTGLSAIDYRISDPHAEPIGMTEHLNVEQLWRLPDVPFCYRAHDNSPDVIDHPPLLDKGFLTFGCFNNFSKVTDPVLALWAKILQQVPNAKLMLEIAGLDDAAFRAEVETRLTSLGLPLERLLLVPRSPKNQYVLYNEIDIVLDPFPCNGGTTSLDTLWMGVPFITLAGRHFTSRMGVTILTNAGLAELIADSEEEYVTKAVALATDLPRLTALRHNLRQRVQQSPLMDAQRFTRNLEQAYRGMWEKWCSVSATAQASSALPEEAIVQYNLAVAHQNQGEYNDAIALYQKALELHPEFPEAYNNLGLIFAAHGMKEEAAHCYQRAVASRPDYAEALNNLGSVLKDQGHLNDAANCYLTALAAKPDLAEAHNNLGIIFNEQGKPADAATCFETAILLRPDYADAHNNLGDVLGGQNRLEEAIACYQKAIQIRPDYAGAHVNMGFTYNNMNKPREAMDCFRKALEYQPDFVLAYQNLLLTMLYFLEYSPKDTLAEHQRFAERFEAPLKAHWQAHSNTADPGKRLKIGYVSPDFRQHAVATFIESLLEQHDRSQVEVFCYYNNTQVDAVTQRLEKLADHWTPCKAMSDDELAQRIRADAIDILIDLTGHTGNNRLLTFARKPAPVQVTYLGYIATTGLSAMDYRLTDAWADPPGMTEHFHTERLWRMPDALFCYRPQADSPAVIDHPPQTDNGFVTFGCLNNFSKVTEATLRLWARLLQRVPDARLLLSVSGAENAETRNEVEARLGNLGLPAERLILVPRQNHRHYLDTYNAIDIGLDPFPFNGGTTSVDTLWMGVPFVTLAGEHFISRMGVSVLTNTGLQELIAHSEEEYLDIAAALASDLPRLRALRDGLRQRVQAGPLMDAPRFARNLEHAYRQMWQAWCDEQRTQEPRSFA